MSHWRRLARHGFATNRRKPTMTARLNPFAAAPSLMKNWQRSATEFAAATNFDPILTELVKMRASQINGCANCI
ncbi:carboxymuconolactone decarboxylase family protein, partial [Tabrizicola sp.]|uniref:carboxymuconolactone decarboxylase family protein n=1 Tax=Tabrizicola sp. TaxID=2005166 RepID=UPI003F2A0CEB